MELIDDNFDWQEYELLPERSKVIDASTLADRTIARMYDESERARGAYVPWDRARDRWRIRPHEVTIYAGVNGHGKSLVTSYLALSLMRQGERVLIASFEMRPEATMERMTYQAAVTDEPSIRYARAFHAWTHNRLWIYDHYGHCEPRMAIAVAQYAAREKGVQHVVIDSLMKVVRGQDDYNGQKQFVEDLCGLSQALPVHIHLVAHARKGKHEGDEIGKFDIRGAGEVADQVDNVVIVQRNKAKEKRVANNEQCDTEPDVYFNLCKQRHQCRGSRYEGTMGLWFDSRSQGYSDRPNSRPHPLELTLREPGEEG